MIPQKWLIHISLLISSMILLFSFQNCGLNLSQKSFGEFKIEQMSTYQGSVCEEELFNEFKKTNGYHDFLKTNCSACHNGSNPNTPRFAHPDPVIAFSKFLEKEIDGNGTISDRAVSNHQPGYTGTKNQTIIDELKLALSEKIKSYNICAGIKSEQKTFKTEPVQFGRLSQNNIDIDEHFNLNFHDDELNFQIDVTKKIEEGFYIIKNPMIKKNISDENAYQVLGINILINGTINKSLTMLRLVNSTICSEKEVLTMPKTAQEMYVPIDGTMKAEDTIQFEFIEVKKFSKTEVQCSPIMDWSVYAGNTDRGDGLEGKKALLTGEGYSSSFAISPINGDVYAVDYSKGLRKLDAKTGKVSTVLFITPGNQKMNMTDNFGPLPDRPYFAFGVRSNIAIDSKGKVYLGYGVNDAYNIMLYQFDFENKTYRKYVGGTGEGNTGGLDPLTVQIVGGNYAFDESNSLYFWSYCPYYIPAKTNADGSITPERKGNIPNKNDESEAAKKVILKVSQLKDGSAGKTENVFGDCNSTALAITNGADATSQPPSNLSHPMYSPILPIENGKYIFFSGYNSVSYKIIEGKLYNSNIGKPAKETSYIWNSNEKFAYRLTNGNIKKIKFNFSGMNNDVVEDYIFSDSKNEDCNIEGGSIKNYCGLIGLRAQIYNGVLYFNEGAIPDSQSLFRVRYIQDEKISTLFGRLPLIGDNQDRKLSQGHFSGIYYKTAAEPNQEAFPEGLYFVDRHALTFGYFSNSEQKMKVLWGNQSKIEGNLSNITINSKIPFGRIFTNGSARPLSFDIHGLPWLRTNNDLIKINESKQVIRKTLRKITYFSPERKNGINPSNDVNPEDYGVYPYIGFTNLTIKDDGIFGLPNYTNEGFEPIVAIRYFDFANKKSPQIIGGSYLVKDASQSSADITTAGNVVNAPLNSGCINAESLCFINYDSSTDRLYLSENNLMRYIEKPTDLASSKLITLFTTDKPIRNFALTPDKKQIWYIKESGLYCYQLDKSINSVCDNQTDYFTSVRTERGWIFSNGANQITFKDNQTLLLSTYNNLILQFNIPDSNSAIVSPTLPDIVRFSDLVGSNLQFNVFATKCLSCHFGSTARGSLDLSNYDQAKLKIGKINDRVSNNTMPPTSAGQLSVTQKNLILKWIQDGGPN